jgi:hypothetical protein
MPAPTLEVTVIVAFHQGITCKRSAGIQADTTYAAIAAGRSGLELGNGNAVAALAVLDLAHVHELAEVDEVKVGPKKGNSKFPESI